jgi:hypothetical protein
MSSGFGCLHGQKMGFVHRMAFYLLAWVLLAWRWDLGIGVAAFV